MELADLESLSTWTARIPVSLLRWGHEMREVQVQINVKNFILFQH
jgi:hypothetical protein